MPFWFFGLLLGGILLQPAAAQVAPAPKDIIATRVQLPGADCALFPAAISLAGAVLSSKPTGRFTPAKEQVTAIERSLLPAHMHYLATNSPYAGTIYADKAQTHIHKNLATYRRQYVGFYNEKHQPCLYINCFPKSIGNSYWLQRLLVVDDGGASFWRISFNLATKQFFDFSYNGVA